MDLPSAPLSDLPMPPANAAAPSTVAGPESKRLPRIVVMALLFEGGLGLVALFFGLWMTDPPWRQLEVNAREIGYGLAATVPMLLALWAMRSVRVGPLARLNSIVDELVAPLFGKCSFFQLALISLVAGIGEELLFRGVVQHLLIVGLDTKTALDATTAHVLGVIAASVIFGLMHFITPTYAILATIVGIYLGWLTLATGELVAPIVADALYDFVALVYLTRTQRAPTVVRSGL